MATRKLYTYLLRTTGPNGESWGGFKWPLKKGAIVKAPDWSPRKSCGHGLHGLVMGAGAGELLDWSENAKWLVLKVRAKEVVVIDAQKAKVPRAEVVYVGTREGAIAQLLKLGADPSAMVCGQPSASGYQGQASASGDYGQASASGTRGQASASGDYGQASASGYQGQASASGTRGQASASGTRGQASASGQNSLVQSRYRVKSGELGILIGLWYDGVRDRVAVAYVGEAGIKPNVWYEVRNGGTFIEIGE